MGPPGGQPTAPGRVTPKQLEVYELLLNHVREHGFQPSLGELGRLIQGGLSAPTVATRISHLVNKGMLLDTPHRTERCFGFVGLKFAPIMVDDKGNPLPDQEFEMGGCVITVTRKGGV